MLGYKELPLKTEKGNPIVYNKLLLKKSIKELENYLDSRSVYKTQKFAYREMFPGEISYNDKIENPLNSTLIYKREGPISRKNIYEGYKYILKNKVINEESLKELYSILSKDLLEEIEEELTGDYYRKSGVYILNNETDFDKAMPAPMIKDKMNDLFDYINRNENNSSIEEFIKSIIIHFYLVYVHPYNDVNGRTARTLQTWYLLNKDEYPYFVFNRAIYQNKDLYKKYIRKARHTGDITGFINFMLKSVLKELRIEDRINRISTNIKLSQQEKIVLQCFYSLPVNNRTFDMLYLKLGIHDLKNEEIIKNMIIKNIFIVDRKDKEIHLTLNEELLYKSKNSHLNM